jgi:hypothetical protein
MTNRTDLPRTGLPAWIHWPVVAVVLPFRLAWELLAAIGRGVRRWVVRPLAWLWDRLVVRPLAWLWHHLVVRPSAWLWRHVLAPAAAWIWRHLIVRPLAWLFSVTVPLWRALGRALAWAGRGVVAVLSALHRWVLAPAWHGAGRVLRMLYRWVLRPAGLAIAWVWNHTVVPVARLVAWVWNHTVVPVARLIAWIWGHTVTPVARWVRDAVLRPAAAATRAVLAAVGLHR